MSLTFMAYLVPAVYVVVGVALSLTNRYLSPATQPVALPAPADVKPDTAADPRLFS